MPKKDKEVKVDESQPVQDAVEVKKEETPKKEWTFYHTRFNNDSIALPNGYRCEFKNRFFKTDREDRALLLMETSLFKNGEVVLHDGPKPKAAGPKIKEGVADTRDVPTAEE